LLAAQAARPTTEPVGLNPQSGSLSFTRPPSISGEGNAYETPSLKRSGVVVFGWLVLAVLLFGGMGALLYAALGERGQRAPSQPDRATRAAPPPVEVPRPAELARPPDRGSGSAQAPVTAQTSDTKQGSDARPPRGRGTKKTARPPAKQVAAADLEGLDPAAL